MGMNYLVMNVLETMFHTLQNEPHRESQDTDLVSLW